MTVNTLTPIDLVEKQPVKPLPSSANTAARRVKNCKLLVSTPANHTGRLYLSNVFTESVKLSTWFTEQYGTKVFRICAFPCVAIDYTHQMRCGELVEQ